LRDVVIDLRCIYPRSTSAYISHRIEYINEKFSIDFSPVRFT